MNSQARPHSLLIIVMLVFTPFTAGYFLTAFFNQVNAVISHSIVQDIHLSAATMGLMTSVYLLAFALFQLPLGLLLDRFGPKRVQPVVFLIAAAGAFVFAHASSDTGLLIGRALLGIGLASGLMSGFKAIRLWFSKERIPLLNGLMMGIGTIGALCSTVPVEMALGSFSWREIINTMGVVTIVIAVLIFLIVPNKVASNTASAKAQVKGIFEIYSSSYFWKIAPIVALGFACNMSMVGLWAGPWFVDVAHLSEAASAERLFAISLALICGIALFGVMADFVTNKLKKPITLLMGAGLILFLFVQLSLVLGYGAGSIVMWFLFGFLGRSITLGYAAVSQHFPPEYSGRAITAINCLMFLTGFVVQYVMGVIVNHWQPISAGHYPAVAYQTAFAIILILQAVALVWFLIFKGR